MKTKLGGEKYFVNEIAHKFEFMDKQEAFLFKYFMIILRELLIAIKMRFMWKR